MSSERERNGGSHRAADRADAPFDPDPKIFAGGLPFSLSPEEVRDLFEQHGTIVEFHLPRTLHDPRKHKGFCFITFDSFKTMDTVIHKMNGTDVAGQTISVARATINKPRHDGPDRAGGGRGYGSGGQDRTYGRDYGTSGRNYGDGGRYDDRGAGAGRYEGRSYTPYDTHRPAKPVKIGYRCRVTGLAPDVDWRLLKDFLRQIGDVTYANVDESGRGIGEYMTLAEVRDAIDKLTGAAINGSVVKVTPHNFDMQTGQIFDTDTRSDHHRPSDRPNSRYDVRGGASDSRYDSRHDGGGSRYDDRGRSGGYDSRDRGGYTGRSSGYESGRGGGGGGSYGARERERSPVGRSGGYGSGGSYRDSGATGGYGSSGRPASGYDRNGGGYGADAAGGAGRYGGGGAAAGGYASSPTAASPAGGSSRYGGGAAAAGGSSRYGGGGGAAAEGGQGYAATGGHEAGGAYAKAWR